MCKCGHSQKSHYDTGAYNSRCIECDCKMFDIVVPRGVSNKVREPTDSELAEAVRTIPDGYNSL
jgi:hypothetical protein